MLGAGFLVARKRAPEMKQIAQADSEMDMILRSGGIRGPGDSCLLPALRGVGPVRLKNNEAYITFYSPRGGIPPRPRPTTTAFPLTKISLYHRMVSLLKVVEYELPDRRVMVHFGWPLSSWWDRMAVGVMVFNLMRLPRMFPQFEFDMQVLPASPGVSSPRRRCRAFRPDLIGVCPGIRNDCGPRRKNDRILPAATVASLLPWP